MNLMSRTTVCLFLTSLALNAVRFEPVIARRVRFHSTESTDGSTIWEFRLFK